MRENGRKSEKFNKKRENRRVNDGEFEKNTMNPHGCVEMWKCDFPLIVPLRLKNVEVNISQQYFVLLFSIFCPFRLPPKLPYGMFLFVTQREHAKFCAKVRKKSQIYKS